MTPDQLHWDNKVNIKTLTPWSLFIYSIIIIINNTFLFTVYMDWNDKC